MGVFEKALIKGDEILDYIPQRAPIVMVDAFFGIEDEITRSQLTVDKDHLFYEAEGLSECGVIEHIAQSAALRMGFLCKQEGKEVPLGYIGSVNQFQLYRLPIAEEKMNTEIVVEQEIMNISLISATVKVKEEVIATSKMKIFLDPS